MTTENGSSGRLETRLLHPLMGSDPVTLLKVLVRNGGVAPSRLGQAALAVGASVARSPFTALERLWMSRRREASPGPGPPIFIVGHWRSGTTYLYNLLSQDPRLAWVSPVATGLPWDFLGLVRVVRPLLEAALPEDRGIDRIPVNPDSPQEDEAALSNMQTLSFYHGLYFPRHFRENFYRGVFFQGAEPSEVELWKERFLHFVHKVALHQPGRRIVIKNPVYTARIAMLRQLLPGARFIHVYRNPFTVYQSMHRFYRVLFSSLALQRWEHVAVDEVILDAYPRMMRACLDEGGRLPAGHYVELRFEELEADPPGALEELYDELGLGGFPGVRPRVLGYLDSIREYRKNRYAYPRESVDRVRERWGEFVERWGYEPPS